LEQRDVPASDAYFFLIGAGISSPQVKLAHAIQQECREIAETTDDPLPADAPSSAMGGYSHWLELAFPNRVERQEYFRGLIETRPISPANFRLAHLISKGPVPRLVVTPNFDDFLARALALFGTAPIVSDHPATAERIDPERLRDIQILHVHGTYWFYDCCNLMGEISARARANAAHRTVASRLDQILDRRSPIVLGYGGWEQDVFMTSLARRLAAGGLRYSLFWFCHRVDEIAALPAFLREHDDVCFVVADAAGAVPAPPTDDDGDGDAADREGNDEGSPPGDGSAGRLDAVTVLDALIRALDLEEPELTQNPIAFFATQLRTSLLESGAVDDDVYGLRSMTARLDQMRDHWERADGAQPGVMAQLDAIETAMRRSQYAEVIEVALALDLGALSDEQLVAVRSSTLLAAALLDDNSEKELASYELVLRACAVADGRDNGDAEAATDTSTALFNKGLLLAAVDRDDEAIATFDDLCERFDGSADPELELDVVNALVSKARSLAKVKRHDEALALYDEVVTRFGDSDRFEVQLLVARALVNKAFRSGRLDRHEEALAACDALLERYGDTEDPALRRHVAGTLLNRGVQLGRLQRGTEALAMYRELLARFGDFEIEAAKALLNTGLLHERLGQRDEALAAFDELIVRYENHEDARLVRLVGRARGKRRQLED